MKTKVEIPDALLERARRHSLRTGQPVRALIEGLRLVLAIDTNILVYAHRREASEHAVAVAVVPDLAVKLLP